MWYVEYISNGRVAFYSQDFDTRDEAEAYAKEKAAQGFKVTVKKG